MKQKKFIYISILLVLILYSSCTDPGIPPLRDCSWNETTNLYFEKGSVLYFPENTEYLNFDEDLALFKTKLTDGYRSDNKGLVRFWDIFNVYQTVYPNRTSRSRVDVSTIATGCSATTSSKSKTYSSYHSGEMEYYYVNGLNYSNNLAGQWYGKYGSDVSIKNNTWQVTIIMGPIFSKKGQISTSGNILWTRAINGSSNVLPIFKEVGTFKEIPDGPTLLPVYRRDEIELLTIE